jgi:hypothetical protein
MGRVIELASQEKSCGAFFMEGGTMGLRAETRAGLLGRIGALLVCAVTWLVALWILI